jgi:hypothetical protein
MFSVNSSGILLKICTNSGITTTTTIIMVIMVIISSSSSNIVSNISVGDMVLLWWRCSGVVMMMMTPISLLPERGEILNGNYRDFLTEFEAIAAAEGV